MENEDIKKEENTEEKVENTEGQEKTEQSETENQDSSTQTNEPSSLKEKWEKHKKKAGIGLLALLLLIGGGFAIAAAAGAFKKDSTEDTNKPVPPAPVGKETTIVIKKETESVSFEDIKNGLSIDVDTKEVTKENLEKYFTITNAVDEAVYTVENFFQNIETKEEYENKKATITIKATKVLDEKGEVVEEGEEFTIEFTTRELVIKTTTIANGTYEGLLQTFKNEIGYDQTPITISNIGEYFPITNAVDGAEYSLEIHSQTKELKTNITITATKSYYEGRIVSDSIFNVELTTNDEAPVAKSMYDLSWDGILTIKPTNEWDYENWNGWLDIPNSVNNNPVLEIAERFADNVKLKTKRVTFDEGSQVKKISKHAFANLGSNSGSWSYTLTLPNSLEIIDQFAFADSDLFIGDLIIPENVTTIGNQAFRMCNNLKGSLTISDSVKTIGMGAFETLKFTKKLTLSSGLTEIGKNAFVGIQFNELENFPKNLISIGEAAFGGCNNLVGTIEFSEGLESIGKGAFKNCTQLKFAPTAETLIIPDSVQTIGANAFENTPLITSITVSAALFANHESTWSQGYTGEVKSKAEIR
ncbi:MAG: leucine-rich repeat protein [Mycoplasma sp.]